MMPEIFRRDFGVDYFLEGMKTKGLALTRENYLKEVDYLQEPLSDEEEAELPKPFRRWAKQR